MSDFPQSVRAIIFDCDGTLTDSMPAHFRSWNKTFADHGIPFSEQQFYSMGGMPSDLIVKTLGDQHGKSLDAKEVAQEKEENFLLFLHQVMPVERVVAVARQQRHHRKMAVASGGFRWVINRQLEHIGLSDWFDAIVTAEDTERHKPHPDVFLEAARQLGTEPAACVVFEDADLGIEAARRAGMPVIDVRTGDWGSSSV